MADLKQIHTEKAPHAIGPYSQGIIAGSMLFTAGQIALDPASGELIAGDISEQTKRVLENLSAILQAAGSSLDRVVKTTVYLSDMGEFGAMNDVYGTYFSTHKPARSTVQAARLPRDVKVEIDAIALV